MSAYESYPYESSPFENSPDESFPYEGHQFSMDRKEVVQRPAGSSQVHPISSPPPSRRKSDPVGGVPLTIALIGPDEERRKPLARTLAGFTECEVRELSSYPPSLDEAANLLRRQNDVAIIDLDSDPKYAIQLVERICASGSATVMVYSAKVDKDLMVRCMRAGAREFLTPPFDQSTITEALARVATQVHLVPRKEKKALGRLLVFFGAKGGSGVTTIACNYAVALGQESGQNTLLIDLGLPLGDAALNLGISTDYSTDNAFLDVDRLDAIFLSKLLAKHRTGLNVLAAPTQVPKVQASSQAIDKMVNVARQGFENVVVDVGSRLDLMGSALFKDASTVFLVTQAGVSELRNSNRVIAQFFNHYTEKLQIVVNRYEPRALGLNDEHIAKALNRSAQWKIPDNAEAARQIHSTTAPGKNVDSPLSRSFRQIARSTCGLPPIQEKTPGFRLKIFGRNTAEKVTNVEEPSTNWGATPTIAWSTPEPIVFGTAINCMQLDAEASGPGTLIYTPLPGYVLPAGTHTIWATFTPEGAGSETPLQIPVSITVIKATPSINWPAARGIACGTALSATELNASASVPGTFVYTPSAGEVLTPGSHELSVTFTPTDAANYTSAEATVLVTVGKATPSVSWSVPATIHCGTPLSDAQLNATASVPGSFAYTPEAGELLLPGKHALSVTFTPEDTSEYATAEAGVEITVVRSAPEVVWPTPAPIAYGTVLSGVQLAATASAPGTFDYTPGEGATLVAGIHTLLVTFTPEDMSGYTTEQATVVLTVTRATPAITWPEPPSIACGGALGESQLNATTPVPGIFTYSPAAGEVFTPGSHEISVTFTPTDTANYTSAQATVSVTVDKATSAMSWSTPEGITYGTALSDTQLNASSSVPGTLAYTPAAGEVLTAGSHELSVTFTPNDTANFTSAQASVSVTVAKAAPAISWPTPEGITCGTELSDAQLNAAASVPGTFAYRPSAGEVLGSGSHELLVTFTPNDTANYTPAQAMVSVTVAKAVLAVSWPAPAPISFGTALSETQLNATASVPGTFAYTPAAGEVLAVGSHELSVTFTPTDTASYTPAQATVSVNVAKATPAMSWPTPALIAYGTALSGTQLNATASVAGTFAYTPAAGEVLAPGRHELSVTFTPTETANYNPAQATAQVTVAKATPTVSWPTPAPITRGTALSNSQLNATASVPGRFTYTPGEGAMLAAGTHRIFVSFTPADAANYNTAQAAVPLTVSKAKPTVAWETPMPISDSTPLSSAQLNAASSVPGTFSYFPPAGELLSVGTHLLSATFTPMDSGNYNTAQAAVSISVTKATPTAIKWETPSAISYGTALSSTQLNATSSVAGTFVYSPEAGDVLTAGKHKLQVTFIPKDATRYAMVQETVVIEVEGVPNLEFLNWGNAPAPHTASETEDHADLAKADRGASGSAGASIKNVERETRVYKGATYEKGEDGQWHLQQK